MRKELHEGASQGGRLGQISAGRQGAFTCCSTRSEICPIRCSQAFESPSGRRDRQGRPPRNIPIDVRVIAATNRRLEEMVQRESFHEDLSTGSTSCPSAYRLLERGNDVILLTDYFCKYCEKYKRKLKIDRVL